MKILVTGATGFVGKHVVRVLQKTEHEIIATSSGKVDLTGISGFEKIKFIPHSIQNFSTENLFEKFEKPDLLIHLAWQGLPNFKNLIHLETNLPAQIFFLKNLISNGLKDVNITGTCFEYGLQNGCLDEEMPVNPEFAYPLAKHTLRKYLNILQKETPFDFKWIRLFYMFGDGQHATSLVPLLEKAIANNDKIFNMSKGDQQRDFLPIEKVAEYIVKISLQKNVQGIINCCSGKPITVLDLVKSVLEKHKSNMGLNLGFYNYADHEPMSFWGDTKKLELILNKK
jgi:nucleoside-diphosphate-sugar epimerase